MNDYLGNLIDSYISSSHRKTFVCSRITLSMIFQTDAGNKIGLLLVGSVFFPFLKIGFSFATLQAFRKNSCEIERSHCAEIDLDNMLAPSFKNLQEIVSTPAALELSIFVIIFKTFSSEALFKQKS